VNEKRLKLVRGGTTGAVTKRRRVRRTPPPPPTKDPITELLEHLDEEPSEEPPKRHVRPQWILAALLGVALAAAGFFGFRWYGDHELDVAHQQAVAAAKQTTVNFVSISATSVDRDLGRIVSGSTGDFHDEFVKGQAQVRSAVVENNVDSRGTVLRAALVSGDRRNAIVLVAVDATVKNSKAPQGRASHYRIQVDLVRDKATGHWLVSRLQFVG